MTVIVTITVVGSATVKRKGRGEIRDVLDGFASS